ncbi:MAG TPA: AarF/UbiB family protein, partial [Longimicrobium sp.]|nr:AarF/UbiB family protein [Longimicrobium sp.]
MRKPRPESPIGTAPPERPGDPPSPLDDPRLELFDDAAPPVHPTGGAASPSLHPADPPIDATVESASQSAVGSIGSAAEPVVDTTFESPAPAIDPPASIDPHRPVEPPASADPHRAIDPPASIDPHPPIVDAAASIDSHPPIDPVIEQPRAGDDADARTPDAETARPAPDPDATVLEPHVIVARTRRRRKETTAESPPVREPAAAPHPPPMEEPAAAPHPPPPPPEPVAATQPPSAPPTPPAPLVKASRPAFVFDPLRPYRGVVRRFFIVYRHVLGLLMGAAVAYVRGLPPEQRRGLHSWFPRLAASLFRPFIDREIRGLPFPQQLRRRLEILGPTYIKLGQIMAIREDLLPRSITSELQNLFDRLPAVPFPQVRERIENSLRAPLETLFRRVEEQPLGSASIAQAHLAETLEGEKVVVKVIKPGVRGMIESDLTLLRLVGGFLQWVLPRYQPRQIIQEFSAYTRKEVDYTFEADNAETFAANFRDMPDVVFPRIYRSLSSTEVLTMEFIRGFKPGSEPTADLTPDERERVVDLGAASIIRMLYRDGFFHADLHAGNLMILPGKRVRMAFIDLGMVGRFEDRTRRQMLYYFHALVTGDIDGATRYLVDMARFGKGGDPNGFRRAVADLSRRFVSHASRGDISIAQLILASVGLGGRYRVFFPVEMTLMVKALVTFEGVGRMLDPRLDVASVSQKHVSKIFQQQFDPRTIVRELLRGSPELVDMAVRLPQLLAAGFRVADEHLNNPTPSNPLAGVRGSILSA